MEKSKEHVKHCLLYEYQLGHSATLATRNICTAIGSGTLNLTTTYRWFKRFNDGDYSLENRPGSGRPLEVDLDYLEELVTSDPRYSSYCLASKLGCSHSTIEYHLNQLGYRSKLGVWVPHELSSIQESQRADICTNLLSLHRTQNWLNNLITGDEKWVVYINRWRNHQWLKPRQQPVTTPKPERHPEKVMLSIWWDVKGVIHWELLPANTTINANIYCSQLERLKAKIETDRPELDKVYFLHDNARPHIAKKTRKKLLGFGWDILPHPAYSPDLAPTDYYLFRSLSNNLRGKIFEEREDIYEYLDNFFKSMPEEFYAKGIHDLPARWQRVVDDDGQYIID